ncbi:MAG: DNA alkylation repair protein, partial [Bacteroidales bacterium]|nr:DNA alkylation repair protein [Bacteroidales bacterium]
GHWLLDKDRSVLYRLSESTLLWEQRVAIISTMTFINHNQFDDTLALVKKQMHHSHDLMHKANGWMLREIGKRNRSVLTAFLDEYTTRLPRTTLRYAIEHYSAEERQYYLKKK